jgi:NAD(P)-dependent dehydrogenase (short-subunit alcohol dehydrogenase family)
VARSVIVTGASAGIGRAAAAAFLDAGWRVGLVARRADRLEELAAGHGDSALVLPADVTAEDQVTRAFAAVADRFGRLDVLFNNAGIFPRAATIDDISLEEWNDALAVNLTGMFLCARAAFAQMRSQTPQGGRIINNGSVSAHAPRPGSTCYTVTKHAVSGLTRSLALDGRPFDIACGQIDIGNARTELAAKIGEGVPQADGSVRAEPMMELAPVTEAVLYMAGLPAGSNVLNMTVMATAMPFVGRG